METGLGSTLGRVVVRQAPVPTEESRKHLDLLVGRARPALGADLVLAARPPLAYREKVTRFLLLCIKITPKRTSFWAAGVAVAVSFALALSVSQASPWLDSESCEGAKVSMEDFVPDPVDMPVFLSVAPPEQYRPRPSVATLSGLQVPTIELVLLLPGHSFSDLSPPQNAT